VNTYNTSENKKQQKQQKYNNEYKRNLVKINLIEDDCMMRKILKRLMCSNVFFAKRTSASEVSMNASEYISALKNKGCLRE
jgi:hypothetical protein